MGRPERLTLIQELEGLRGSRVLCYVTSDRPPAGAQIGDDAIRPLYEHLRALDPVEKLDVFIYSRGGATNVPWRMATAIRSSCKEWHVLVPFRANSAATLLAMGAETIVMGKQAELGPIDPILQMQRLDARPGALPTMVQDTVNVEDIMSYVKFIRERAGLSDQSALAQALGLLGQRLDAITLGNSYRTHSHIRDVARRMLQSRRPPASDAVMNTIVETLAEKVYAHDHAIGLKDAAEIGLPAEAAPADVDDAMWRLLKQYEQDLHLLEPIDPVDKLGVGDLYQEADYVSAVIESSWGLHQHGGRLEIKAKRQMPATLNVAVNLNVQIPPAMPPNQQAALAQLLQQLQPLIVQAAQQAAQQAVQQQAPVLQVEVAVRGAKWAKAA